MADVSKWGAVLLRRHVAWVFAGAVALGVGSVLLLIGAVVWLAGGGEAAFVLRLPAIAIQFVGWMFLLMALMVAIAIRRMGDGRPLVPRLVNAWCLSVIGALVGIATLPWIFSQTYCTIICTPWGFILVGRFYFPYVPSMFAPVIAAHAAFFYLDWRFVGFGARKLGMGGVIVLALLAVVSISIQAAGWFVGPAYLLAGLTAVGYFLVAASLLRQLSVAPFASLFGDGSARPEGL